MTLSRISLVTAVIVAALNVAILFGVDIDEKQLAGINTLLLAVGAAVHSWFDPDSKIPIGKKDVPA